MIDLTSIPQERLALLDTATIYHGSHRGGGPDCRHCARELLHEVATGLHKDANADGFSQMWAILCPLNDGYWFDDAHRTAVFRPYLPKLLRLDPALDEKRTYALMDYVYRIALPDICAALKLDKHGSELRDLKPIIDLESALAVLDTRAASAASAALAFLSASAALAALDAIASAAALAFLDTRAALAPRAALDPRAVLATLDIRVTRAVHAVSWGNGTREVLDLICSIN